MADNLNSVSLCPLGSKVLDAFLLPQECPFSRVLILFATNVNCHYLHFPLRNAFFLRKPCTCGVQHPNMCKCKRWWCWCKCNKRVASASVNGGSASVASASGVVAQVTAAVQVQSGATASGGATARWLQVQVAWKWQTNSNCKCKWQWCKWWCKKSIFKFLCPLLTFPFKKFVISPLGCCTPCRANQNGFAVFQPFQRHLQIFDLSLSKIFVTLLLGCSTSCFKFLAFLRPFSNF